MQNYDTIEIYDESDSDWYSYVLYIYKNRLIKHYEENL